MRTADFRACVRLDLADALRSRWFLFAAAVYAALVGMFLLAGLHESALFGFTGVGRTLFGFTHALLVVLPLLALLATGQVVSRARDEGVLEVLVSHGTGRGAWLAAVALVRALVIWVPLAALVVIAGLCGLAWGEVPWGFLGRALAVAAALTVAFTGMGVAISVFARTQARALVAVLLVWALAVALLDLGLIGLMLRSPMPPQLTLAVAAANPVEAARLALLSGLASDLATLGPVGFWAATRLGDAALFAFGLAWPVVAGALAFLAALLRFRKGDIT
jgi:ABC-type transport system involved in multi-copper enzyme maturation permease subunit